MVQRKFNRGKMMEAYDIRNDPVQFVNTLKTLAELGSSNAFSDFGRCQCGKPPIVSVVAKLQGNSSSAFVGYE
jgi:hypothetical protein